MRAPRAPCSPPRAWKRCVQKAGCLEARLARVPHAHTHPPQVWRRSLGVARRSTDQGWLVGTLVLSLSALRGSAAAGELPPGAALSDAAVLVALTALVLLFARCWPEGYYRVRPGMLFCVRLARAVWVVTRIAPGVRAGGRVNLARRGQRAPSWAQNPPPSMCPYLRPVCARVCALCCSANCRSSRISLPP